ncbi:MAG: hypothetical protein ACK5MU_01010 [Candidatus Saccharimonadales bacterium]
MDTTKTLYLRTSSGAPELWCRFSHYATNWDFPVKRVNIKGSSADVIGYVAGEGRDVTVIFDAKSLEPYKDHIKEAS